MDEYDEVMDYYDEELEGSGSDPDALLHDHQRLF